jgi:NAD(P)-dependent dehydrogenase (short-subunit alcohol dehydrogenase family)
MSDQTPASHLSPADRRVLVTGATSGLGFEAAAQLAELGYGTVVITARNDTKAADAKRRLKARTGRDVFESVVVDLASVASSQRAAAELTQRGAIFDDLLLNAGMVPNDKNLTDEGLEVCFSSSLTGHHIVTEELIESQLLRPDGRVVIVGSEAANNDLPKAMGMRVAEFAIQPPINDQSFIDDIKALARGDRPANYDGNTQYATTKVVSAWWAAAMQRRHGNRFDFFTVSPGANLGTDAARHTTGAFKVMLALMGRFGHLVGMNQPVEQGAGRYVDVITGAGSFTPGRTYTSKPKKMVGDMVARDEPHLLDRRSQDLALTALDQLVEEIQPAGLGS